MQHHPHHQPTSVSSTVQSFPCMHTTEFPVDCHPWSISAVLFTFIVFRQKEAREPGFPMEICERCHASVSWRMRLCTFCRTTTELWHTCATPLVTLISIPHWLPSLLSHSIIHFRYNYPIRKAAVLMPHHRHCLRQQHHC